MPRGATMRHSLCCPEPPPGHERTAARRTATRIVRLPAGRTQRRGQSGAGEGLRNCPETRRNRAETGLKGRGNALPRTDPAPRHTPCPGAFPIDTEQRLGTKCRRLYNGGSRPVVLRACPAVCDPGGGARASLPDTFRVGFVSPSTAPTRGRAQQHRKWRHAKDLRQQQEHTNR